MAVKFYRISEKGSIKRPTLTAIGYFALFALIAVFFLYDYPVITMLIVWPALYVFSAVIFSAPVRVTLSKFMHWTRYPLITSKPVSLSHDQWSEANSAMLKKTKLKLFKGINQAKEPEGPEIFGQNLQQ